MTAEVLGRLYRQMYRIRRTEEVIADLYPQQQMRCPVHLCIGQEAAPAGVCDQLEPGDYVFSTHRSHGHYLAKGGCPKALFGELYGRETGCSMGKGGSMHLVDLHVNFLGAAPILAATIALAVGAAFGTRLRGEKRVTVAFFGDAAVEEGTFYEAASFAVLKQVPVVLVCENNGLSTCSSLSVRQPPGRSIAEVARAIGLRTATGDGNDVLEVHRLAGEAVTHARQNHGPVFLEFATYRWREHCGPGYDWDLGYRSEAEGAEWRRRCPLVRLEKQMRDIGAWDQATVTAGQRAVDVEIDQAVKFAQASRYPAPGLLLEHEYAP